MESNVPVFERLEIEGLKPCPFCGAAPKCTKVYEGEYGPELHFIECTNPDCWVEWVQVSDFEIDSCIELWNRRNGDVNVEV